MRELAGVVEDAYFAAAFLIFLLFLFPFDRIKSRIESEVRLRTPVELSISRISPRFFNRFALIDVVVSDRTGKELFKSPSVHTKVSLFGLLRGLLSIDLNTAAYGGELSVKARQGASPRALRCPRTRFSPVRPQLGAVRPGVGRMVVGQLEGVVA